MNSIRLFHLFFVLAVALFQAPRLAAQNDRGIALNNVEALIQNLEGAKPRKTQVESTYSPVYFYNYDAVQDHVQGMARLSDGRYVFSHSTMIGQKGLIVFSRPDNAAVYRAFRLDDREQSHPSAIQACGNIVAVPTTDAVASIHFFDGTDPDNPVELTHLTIDSTGNAPLNGGIDAVGLVYNELRNCHYLSATVGREFGIPDGDLYLFKSNGLPLTDPNCRFRHVGSDFNCFTGSAGTQLLYDVSGQMYVAALYRPQEYPESGKEKIALSKINMSNDSTLLSADQLFNITLSHSTYYNNSLPGFRWGGGIRVTGPNTLEVFASARLLTNGPGADFCVIRTWEGESPLLDDGSALTDCRKYIDVSWLTSYNSFATYNNGYVVNSQNASQAEQLEQGLRAFTLGVWEQTNLNAPNAGPDYNTLKDKMIFGSAYFLNDPRRLKPNGDCCEGINLQGTAWPENLNANLSVDQYGDWFQTVFDFLASHPSEIITVFLEGNASVEAQYSSLKDYQKYKLSRYCMNASDFDNLHNLTLGEIRKRDRRLIIFNKNGTLNFNHNGTAFQFRAQFEKTVENTVTQLPDGLNTCDNRAESDPLSTSNRLVVFNHLGQTFHAEIARRWLLECSDVNVPNFVLTKYSENGIFGIQPKDAVREFNRRLRERAVGTSVTYRILVADSDWNITQESDDDGARVVTSDNAAEWEFILSDDDRSYYIRLKGTNRYIIAPLNVLNACYMSTDYNTNRARWYVEPLGGKTVRIFCKHEYGGTTRKALRIANNNLIKMSDNIDFVDVAEQKFELYPVVSLSVTCKPATIVLNESGSAVLLPDAIKDQLDYSGVCEGELYFTADRSFFSCADVGTHQVGINVADDTGLNASCSATVTVVDNAPTILECPGAQIISANDICKGVVGSWSPTRLEDNCVGNLTVAQTPTAIRALNGHNDSELVTLTANDGHGNLTECSFTVTLKDNTGPVITCKNATTNLDNSGVAVIGYGLVYVGGSDNCGGVNLESISKTLFRCADIGPNTVTVTANDGNGNIGTCTATVTVVDNRAPNVVCNPFTAFLNQAGTVNILPNNVYQSGSDNCGTVNLVSVVPSAFNCNNLGANTVVLTANDGRGNLSTCSATVTIVDDIQPTVICKPYTAFLNQAGAASITSNDVFQSGADNCSVVNQVSVAPNTFNCSNLGANTVTLMVNDGNGNTATCSSTVTVVDNIAPTVECKPFTAYLDNLGAVSITPGNVFQSGADNCSVVNQVSVAPNTFNCSNLGTNTVLLTINDGKGNLATCNATVTVVDNLNPTVVCKTFTAHLNAAGNVNIGPADVFQSGADNCGVVNLGAVAPSSFTCAQLGSNQVTLTVNDGHGNGASCNTFVTVKDVIIPTMICKNVTINLNASGQATLSVAQVNNGSFDNCTLSNMGLSQTLFTCANAGLNNVTLGGTDQSQNKGQCLATITVLDAILPVAKCKVFSANLNVNGTVTVAPTAVDNGSYDNCTFSTTLTPNVFTCANIGLNSVTLRATDASGNSATCATKVTIKDVTAPSAICKNTTIFLNDLGQATLSTAQVNNGSSDACGISSMTLTKTQFNCGDLFTPQTVTLTLKDVNNNQSSCTAQISVKDNLAPTANCENITVELGPNGTVTVFGADLADGSYDNCSIWIFEPTAKVFTLANLGNNNVNVNVKDGSNNLSTCTAVVTVLPNIGFREEKGPVLSSAGIDLLIYPNPTSAEVTLSFQLPKEQGFVIRTFDLAGRQIYHQEGVGLEGNNSLPLRFEGIAPGIYWIDFQTSGSNVQKRLVVQR